TICARASGKRPVRPKAARNAKTYGPVFMRDVVGHFPRFGHFTTKRAANAARRNAMGIDNVLTERWRVSVGEYNRTTGFDHRRILRRHNIHAEIQLARRDAEYGNQ